MSTNDLDTFFVAYRVQLYIAIIALIINLIICIYSFCVFDCFNPHTTMWRTQLILDICIAIGYILDSCSFISLENSFSSLNNNNNLISQQQPQTTTNISSSLDQLIKLTNNTVTDCNNKKPHLFLLLACRQWAAVLVFIMGLERVLFLCYPLWFRSIRVRKSPINTFVLFFVLFSAGIAYTNVSMVCPYEPTHFTCELTWAFGIDYGYLSNGIIILSQLFGFIFLVIAAYFVHRLDWPLRRFGGNRNKVISEKRKIRKIKWLILSCLVFIAFPQFLLLLLHFKSPNGLYLIKLIVSWLFLTKMFSNIYIYILATRYGKGMFGLIKEWWKNRKKTAINPNESMATIVASQFINRQVQTRQLQMLSTIAN
ncbi:unnamed protein product [Meloidogyne enterolobii]|uniref:G-protein coupled receptors family 1 profile domain-containing protein n=2 Tax=Meloidogyne enterolobii TaxID=390850 RepID=A0A6V7XSC9_MELEN|nr:unnamed protein product [Meloidogyne enterolobii]